MSGNLQDALQLEQGRLELVERLRVRLPEAVEAVLTYMLSCVPDSVGCRDVRFASGWREVVNACLEWGLLGIEHGEEWAGPIPAVVLVQARRAAGIGVELSTDLKRYRATYKAAWVFILEEIGHSEVSERHKRIVLQEASAVTMSLLARLLAEITDVHFGALRRFLQTSSERRAALVRKILGGERVDQSELDYDLGAEHLAVIATGIGVEKALGTLARRLGRQVLLVSQDDGTVAAWLRGANFRLADMKLELDEAAYANVTMAIGRPASRVAGFRRTYRLAQAAFLVAQHWPQEITWYDDVAREAHALQDDDYATSLIETYITPLDKGRQGASLRQTLKAFYATGYNEAKAAKLLKIHRHTVERHLDRTKELIGRELHTCHGEIELALRLVELQDLRAVGNQLRSRW